MLVSPSPEGMLLMRACSPLSVMVATHKEVFPHGGALGVVFCLHLLEGQQLAGEVWD